MEERPRSKEIVSSSGHRNQLVVVVRNTLCSKIRKKVQFREVDLFALKFFEIFSNGATLKRPPE